MARPSVLLFIVVPELVLVVKSVFVWCEEQRRKERSVDTGAYTVASCCHTRPPRSPPRDYPPARAAPAFYRDKLGVCCCTLCALGCPTHASKIALAPVAGARSLYNTRRAAFVERIAA